MAFATALMRKTVWPLGLVLILASGVWAQGGVVDRIVAEVNTEIILLSELEEKMAPLYFQIDSSELSDQEKETMKYEAREEMLKNMIGAILARQESGRLGVTVTRGEIDAYLERFKQAGAMTDEALRQRLKADGITMEMLRDQIRDTLLISKLKNTEVDSKIVITDKEIETYYNEHAEEFAGSKKYHLHYILMHIPPVAGRDEKDAKIKALRDMLDMLDAGESFAYLEEKISEPALGGAGGDLGVFGLEDLTQDVAGVIKGMKPGEVTDPIPVEQGLQVFWVEDVLEEGSRSLEEAREEIHMMLYAKQEEARYARWISDLEKEAYIRIVR